MTSFESYTELQEHFTKEQVLSIVNYTKGLSTKDDLADLATKQDINKLATKDDIKEILKDISKSREDMMKELAKSREDILKEFSKSREDNTKDISKIYQEIGTTRELLSNKIYWTSFVQVLAIIGAIAAIIKFIIAK